MKVFMLAGESSGDALGAPLIQSLNKINQDIDIIGIGGAGMIKAGLKSLLPMEELNIIGIWEVISQLPRLLKLINGVVEEVEKHQPDIYLGIDFPDFNFEVAKRLKKRGVFKGKILHYVAPTVWAWRPGRAKKIAGFLDGLFCLFPFEPDYFKPHGLKAWYVGHSIIERNIESVSGEGFKQSLGIKENRPTCGLFFGSRPSELESMGKTIVEAAIYIQEQIPNIEFIVPTLPHMELGIRGVLESLSAPVHLIINADNKYEVFKSCDSAIAVSGTVGLELSYCDVPHAIGYKTNILTYFLVKTLAQTKYIHLSNILLKQDAVPELIQHRFTPENMADEIITLYDKNSVKRDGQLKSFEKLRLLLNQGIQTSPSDKAASIVQKIMGPRKAPS